MSKKVISLDNLQFDCKLLQKLRIRMGLTQQELANRFGFNLNTLIKWENGYSKPRLFEMYRLARFFGKSMEDFIIDKGDMFNVKCRKIK